MSVFIDTTFHVIEYIDIEKISTLTKNKRYIPIGSVEFCRSLAKNLGITLKEDFGFIERLSDFYAAPFKKTLYKDVPDDFFIKPAEKIKQFNAGIKKHTLKESVPENTPVFMAKPVRYIKEWRFYILNGEIKGFSRYDDGLQEETPEEIEQMKSLVLNILTKFDTDIIGYSIDVGLFEKEGRAYPALIEINDGWALGLYQWGNDAISSKDYLALIERRWMQIVNV